MSIILMPVDKSTLETLILDADSEYMLRMTLVENGAGGDDASITFAVVKLDDMVTHRHYDDIEHLCDTVGEWNLATLYHREVVGDRLKPVSHTAEWLKSEDGKRAVDSIVSGMMTEYQMTEWVRDTLNMCVLICDESVSVIAHMIERAANKA